jgi:hypothetical protein
MSNPFYFNPGASYVDPQAPQPNQGQPGPYDTPWYNPDQFFQPGQDQPNYTGTDQQIGATNNMGMPGFVGPGQQGNPNDFFGGMGNGGLNRSGVGSFDNPQANSAPLFPQGQGFDNNSNGFGSMANPVVNGTQLYPASAQTATVQPQTQGQAQGQAGTSGIPTFQRALEDPNGPYANRQVGDYAPSTAPLNVQNPQTLKDWQDRYYWFQQHQDALANPSAPRTQSATNPDYSMPWTVPGSQFAKNVYADSNAQQSFKELQGTLTPDQLNAIGQQYGWQPADKNGVSPDQNAVYRNAIALATADPNSDYSIVKVQTANGLGYGIVKREQSQAAQQARGFIAPGTAPLPKPGSSNGGGGGSGSSGVRSSGFTSPRPAPQPQQQVAASHTLPPPGASGQPINYSAVDMQNPVNGQIIRYNGQLVQRVNGRWVPYGTSNGGQQHVVPI